MNKTFQWNRFCKVVHKDFSNIWQHFGTTMLIITLLPLAVWLLILVVNGLGADGHIVPEFRWTFIAGCVILVAIMAPSRIYQTCNIPKEGVYFAMLPASKLEKYLSMVLLCVVVCPLICLLGGVVLDMVLAALPFGPYTGWIWDHTRLSEIMDAYRIAEVQNSSEFQLYSKFLAPGRLVLLVLLGYLGYCATFLFTSTIFKKHKVLMTFLWIWLISFVLQLVATPIMGSVLGDWMSRLLENDNPVRIVNGIFWGYVVWEFVVDAVLFWWAGYRLKKMRY